ncbi:hypothetical protein ACXYN8_01990 [Altererythrobacter sp. CAU 1778]
MKTAFARALMALAAVALGQHRSSWAEAMQAEFAIAEEHGESVGFALGCLWSAWRELPFHTEGQLALARYTLIIGAMLPAAGLVFAGLTMGYPFVQHPYADTIESVARHLTGLPTLNEGNAFSLPFLFAIVAVVACCNTAAAWYASEQRWDAAYRMLRLSAASLVTLAILAGVTVMDGTCVAVPLLGTLVQLFAVTQLDGLHRAHGSALTGRTG